MKIKECSCRGFTLIELLVVIIVIVVLAWMSLPVFGTGQVRSAQTKALANAKQIGLACKLFAGDNDGRYPSNLLDSKGKLTTTPPSSANATLAQLIPDYIPDEKIFWLAQDKAYCNASEPDNKSPWLGPGENHWGYVINLTEKSTSNFPLVADSTALGGTAYSAKEGSAGGIWKGKRAIVICVDGSGQIEKLNTTTLTIPGPTPDIPDLLQAGRKNWLGTTNTFLNPIPKAF